MTKARAAIPGGTICLRWSSLEYSDCWGIVVYALAKLTKKVSHYLFEDRDYQCEIPLD